MEEQDENIFAWEKTFDRAWEGVEEDESGALKMSIINQQRQMKVFCVHILFILKLIQIIYM